MSEAAPQPTRAQRRRTEKEQKETAGPQQAKPYAEMTAEEKVPLLEGRVRHLRQALRDVQKITAKQGLQLGDVASQIGAILDGQ